MIFQHLSYIFALQPCEPSRLTNPADTFLPGARKCVKLWGRMWPRVSWLRKGDGWNDLHGSRWGFRIQLLRIHSEHVSRVLLLCGWIWQIILGLISGDGGFSTPKSTLTASNSQGVELGEITVRSRFFLVFGCRMLLCLYVVRSADVWVHYCSWFGALTIWNPKIPGLGLFIPLSPCRFTDYEHIPPMSISHHQADTSQAVRRNRRTTCVVDESSLLSGVNLPNAARDFSKMLGQRLGISQAQRRV